MHGQLIQPRPAFQTCSLQAPRLHPGALAAGLVGFALWMTVAMSQAGPRPDPAPDQAAPLPPPIAAPAPAPAPAPFLADVSG